MAKLRSKTNSPTEKTKVMKKKSSTTKNKNGLQLEHESSKGSCGAVFSGVKISRLRIYNDGRVFAYKFPGANQNYIGATTDANIIKALFLARDNERMVTGYTDDSCRITFLDY